jgi:NAD+ diphosphatase
MLAFAGDAAAVGWDRAADRRGDTGALLAQGRVLILWHGKPLMRGDALVWMAAADLPAGCAAPVFLGLVDGADSAAARFAVDLQGWQPTDAPTTPGIFDDSRQMHPDLPGDTGFADLRMAMTAMTTVEAMLAATARALTGWHASHGHCAACGAATYPAQSGWQRDCPACGAHHFPRTDPVVIMLVLHGNRTLIGRNAAWPPGMYSCLAGFVEPGETIEDAVRREVREEAGVSVGRVTYVASQPWPFPASLMLGCVAEALTDTITVDPAELEDARWVTREDMATVMAGDHPVLRPARNGAIAHHLLQLWLADRLPVRHIDG